MSAVLSAKPAARQSVLLSEVVQFNPKPMRNSIADELEVSFVPMAAVEAGSGRMHISQTRQFSEVKKGFTHFRDGDVLFAKITPCMENGKMAVAGGLRNGIGYGSTEFHVLRPSERLDARYLYYFVSSRAFRKEAAHRMTGAVGLRRVPISFLEECEIPIPSMADQRLVVAEIEKQFSRLDEAVANLLRVKANLRRYEKSALRYLMSGREESAVTDELAEIPNGWEWKTLPELGELSRGKSKHRPRDDQRLYGGPYPFIQTGDVRRSGGKISEFTQTYSDFGLQQSRLWPVGTLCITIAANIAETGILALPACFPDSIVGFFSDDSSLTRFVELFMRTAREDLERFAPATAQKNINLAILERVLVPVPPRGKRVQIVAEVDRRLSIARGVEAQVDTNLKRAQSLRQAVLAKAFGAAC